MRYFMNIYLYLSIFLYFFLKIFKVTLFLIIPIDGIKYLYLFFCPPSHKLPWKCKTQILIVLCSMFTQGCMIIHVESILWLCESKCVSNPYEVETNFKKKAHTKQDGFSSDDHNDRRIWITFPYNLFLYLFLSDWNIPVGYISVCVWYSSLMSQCTIHWSKYSSNLDSLCKMWHAKRHQKH